MRSVLPVIACVGLLGRADAAIITNISVGVPQPTVSQGDTFVVNVNVTGVADL